MVTLDDYNDDSVAACKSVPVEAFTVLGRYRRHLVLVGGWVPPLLMPGAGHIGSIDVDLAIDSRQIPAHLYETIGNDLRKAGYRATDLPNRFEREVRIGDNAFTVRLDLITGEYGHAAAAILFHVAQEAANPISGKVFHAQQVHPLASPSGHERQKLTEHVAITVLRVAGKVPVADEVLKQEASNPRTK